jgi:dephospho-CoA kinase
MLWIGLTGGLASGKTTVTNILRKKKIAVICADELARLAVAPKSLGLQQVLSDFGTDLLNSNGELDRKKLGEKVFKNKQNLVKLESIIHPIVRQLGAKQRNELELAGEKIAFYDVPLLFEKNMQSLFDKIIVVTTSPENQMRRAILRDGLSEIEIHHRLQNQLPMSQKINSADFIIENNSTLQDLELAVDRMLLAVQ